MADFIGLKPESGRNGRYPDPHFALRSRDNDSPEPGCPSCGGRTIHRQRAEVNYVCPCSCHHKEEK